MARKPQTPINVTAISYWLPPEISEIERNTRLLDREAWLFNKLAAIIEAANRAAQAG